jgi:hypothetical protein
MSVKCYTQLLHANIRLGLKDFLEKHFSLFSISVSDEEKGFDTLVQCYETFYGRNLQIIGITLSVCLLQAFPAWSNVCGQGQEPML